MNSEIASTHCPYEVYGSPDIRWAKFRNCFQAMTRNQIGVTFSDRDPYHHMHHKHSTFNGYLEILNCLGINRFVFRAGKNVSPDRSSLKSLRCSE